MFGQQPSEPSQSPTWQVIRNAMLFSGSASEMPCRGGGFGLVQLGRVLQHGPSDSHPVIQ
jgi:hypothetical protein